MVKLTIFVIVQDKFALPSMQKEELVSAQKSKNLKTRFYEVSLNHKLQRTLLYGV
jgi:hypothetical protein